MTRDNERPLLSLVAILKNERSCIGRTLDSVKPWVDRWYVLDTGSTDGTQKFVLESMQPLSGVLVEEPFVDFAASRNRVLELVETHVNPLPIFTLMLSADEVLVGGDKLREYLEAHRDAPHGAYTIWLHSGGSSRTLSPRIFRTSGGWRYVGDPHEVPEGPVGERIGPTIPGVSIIHEATDPERRLKRMMEYDLPRLQTRAYNEAAELEERAHAIFLLGQTYEAIANAHPKGSMSWAEHRLKALQLYQLRSTLGDDPLKSSYAYFCFLNVANQLGFLYTHEEMIARLEMLSKVNPHLPEIRYMMAVHAAQLDTRRGLFLAEEAAKVARKANEMIAAGDQTLYLPTDQRVEWLSYLLAAGCAKATGNMVRACSLAKRGIEAGGPPDNFSEFV